jgi:hypothetical protein
MKKEKPEVPLLIEKWQHFFDEVEPDMSAQIRFYYSTARGHPAVIVTVQRAGTAKMTKFSIVEYADAFIDDLALEVRMNDKYVATFSRGPRRPWFLDAESLKKRILTRGREKTLRDIIAWLTHPFDEIVKELSEVGE